MMCTQGNKKFQFLECICWCMGGECQLPPKFTHEKSVRKQCRFYFVIYLILSCRTDKLYFYYLNVLNFKRSFRKSVAHCTRRFLRYVSSNLDYIFYYTLCRESVFRLIPNIKAHTIWRPTRTYLKIKLLKTRSTYS